jgi:starch synthase
MNVWLVSREYSGIAEAGGVKNVSCSLSESLVHLGHRVTLFIPLYKCTELSNVSEFSCFWKSPVSFPVAQKKQTVSFAHGISEGVEIVFVCHKSFAEKMGVYTYTKEEQDENPCHVKGCGHEDADFLNALFQRAVVEFSGTCTEGEKPDIVHCQDAPTSLIPPLVDFLSKKNSAVKKFFSAAKFVVTIHNAGPGYHHEFKSIQDAVSFTSMDENFLRDGLNGKSVEPFLLASKFAAVTTVSPWYAKEILSGASDTAGLSEGFNRLGKKITGITNGIDFLKYDPVDTKKSLLPFAFDPEKKDLDGKYECRNFFLEKFASEKSRAENEKKSLRQSGFINTGGKNDSFVYVAYHGRVVQQKGIEVIAKAAEIILSKKIRVKFIFAGQGSVEQENVLSSFCEKFAGDAVYLKGYEKNAARLAIASCDFSLHPSYFEPCGLEDFIAQTFGTIPVAHETGGLCKIIDDETGFLYRPNSAEILAATIESLANIMNGAGREIFKTMISYASRYIHENYAWDRVAFDYEILYKNLLKEK